MDSKFTILIEKLLAGHTLSADETNELKGLFLNNSNNPQIDQWLTERWLHSDFKDVPISFDRLKEHILKSEEQAQKGSVTRVLRRVSIYYQQIAAVLLIPLLLGFVFFSLRKAPEPGKFTAEAPLGQKAKVELPDGSMVWLNSGSKISYSSDYNKKLREIDLNGEAYFDVQKNKGKPFFVHTTSVDVEVTGTKFNLNAYGDESLTETSLLEGHVNLYLKDRANQKIELEPGNTISYSEKTNEASLSKLDSEATIAWKDNRLIFINDDFYKLAKKIERWYNMEVVYNPEDFQTNKLTVRLLEGEQLTKLLQIIESAVGAKCKVTGSKIYITKK